MKDVLDALDVEMEQDLEQIKPALPNYPFPAVCVTESSILFTTMCGDLDLWDTGRIKIFTTTNYVVFKKASRRDASSFAVWDVHAGCNPKATGFPLALRAKMIRRGTYRLYKYGADGYAIKRNELLSDEAE